MSGRRPPVSALGALLLACAAWGCGEPPAVRVETAPAGAPAPAAEAAPVAPADAPRAIAFDPPLGATGVDPSRATLSVTFDREMDREGWAWVIEDQTTAPELGESSWDESGRTQTVAVSLRPGSRYVVWVNSPRFAYFRDLRGVTSPPVRWTFSTAGAPAPGGSLDLLAAHAPSGPPRIAALEPANGATGVDPELARLVVTFDREMAEGWSWVTEGGDSFPELAGAAGQSPDRRQAWLPVRLEPGRAYVVWLNSETYRNFRDPAGAELAPLRWTFTTAPER